MQLTMIRNRNGKPKSLFAKTLANEGFKVQNAESDQDVGKKDGGS